jgi:hypothetical protein
MSGKGRYSNLSVLKIDLTIKRFRGLVEWLKWYITYLASIRP